MTIFTSYTELISAVQQITEDDGTEFIAYIPTAINLAEERLFRELDLPELEKKVTGTCTPGVATLTKPGDYELGEYLKITPSVGTTKMLKKRLESFCLDYWQDLSATGTPKYYSDQSKTAFTIVPTPSSNFAYELKYSAKPTYLSSTNASNYYIENCKDALFSATMLEIVLFSKSWSQAELWNTKFSNHRDTWNIEQGRYRADGNESFNTPKQSGPNTLRNTIDSRN